MTQIEQKLYAGLLSQLLYCVKMFNNCKGNLSDADFMHVLSLLYTGLSQASSCRARASRAFNHRLSLLQIGYDAISTANAVLLKRTMITLKTLDGEPI